ncbi:MAG TPA: hypothetical protein VF292_07860 [Rhodanobacteraceae bacterium]
MVCIDTASTTCHFEQILNLQRRYHVSVLQPAVQAREGFVFAQHSIPLLRRMAAELPQAIALDRGLVVGYCLAMPCSLRNEVPNLVPMFEQFGRCAYHGRPLSSQAFFVGGQVCVDRPYRGRGLLARLYEHVRSAAPANYELCVTEIAARNRVSFKAHTRMGFERISTYSVRGEAWIIVAWKLTHEPVHRE